MLTIKTQGGFLLYPGRKGGLFGATFQAFLGMVIVSKQLSPHVPDFLLRTGYAELQNPLH
jgi:hypothetical protein